MHKDNNKNGTQREVTMRLRPSYLYDDNFPILVYKTAWLYWNPTNTTHQKKIDRVITAPHCILCHDGQQQTRRSSHHVHAASVYMRIIAEDNLYTGLLIGSPGLFTHMSLTESWTSGLNLGLHPANERRRYKVTPSPIGWVQTLNQPWTFMYWTCMFTGPKLCPMTWS